MTVFDLRGTHGAGKSYIMSSLLKMKTWEPVMGEGQATKTGPIKVRHLGYECKEWSAFIMGKYDLETGRGGCDLLFPEEVVKRVLTFHEQYKLILLEGVLVAHTFQRYSDLANQVDDYRFLFLDTPLKECIRRMDERRAKMDQTKIRPRNIDNLVRDHRAINITTRNKIVAKGHYTQWIDHRKALPQILKEVRKVVK